MSEFNFQILHKDIFPDRPVTESSTLITTFTDRPTVKIVLKDADNKICLVSKKESGFYFLPGGGIEENENPIEAIQRESLEEAGCYVEVTGKIGTVTEYRDESQEKRIVSCYNGKVISEKISPTLAVGDEEGFDVVWLTPQEGLDVLKKQLTAITESTNNFYARKFNTVRDLKILESIH